MKIHNVYQSYRKKPYVARWCENERMRNRFFSTEQARTEFIDSFKQSSAGQDPSLPAIDPHKIIRWQQAAQIAPEADPVEVYRFWSAAQTKRKNQEHRALAQAIPPYVDAMERMKRTRPTSATWTRRYVIYSKNSATETCVTSPPPICESTFSHFPLRGYAPPPAHVLAGRFRLVAQAGLG